MGPGTSWHREEPAGRCLGCSDVRVLVQAQTRHPCWHHPSLLCHQLRPPGRAWQQCGGVAGCVSHSLALLALYQSAGTVAFRLINVQFSVYYEPPGFNYYTITQSVPCHLIFMAFIIPLSVQLPDFILEGFHLISRVYTILLICLGFYLSRCVFPTRTLCFYQQDRLFVLFLRFLGCFVLLSLETALGTLCSGVRHISAAGATALPRPEAWICQGQPPPAKWPVRAQGRCAVGLVSL